VGDGEKLLTYSNSALKVLLGTDIFPVCKKKKKLNFVAQCYEADLTAHITEMAATWHCCGHMSISAALLLAVC
jgi:hypothetical protein